ncbi:ornithine cyclodeaminase family protein [Ramlibacter henchirensis]|uniref:Ornithine cyclodeaminase family protein n=1 Tax=Ramlibacter henchirensis TaxID=204072 RepID=A0A4Z0BVP0_9BURK|nr:ornithine cyclodeaminase family protein [Ramlibacter henchirensis]TFZ02772.1 ornithine cyclodeaminase family protein [Ramlibacter henchirensis]
MALFLNEKQVDELLSLKEAIDALEQPIREQGLGLAFNKPRTIVKGGKGSVSVLPAAIPSIGSMGFKTYTVGPEGARFWLMLFAETGELQSLMESENISRIRTGAATAIATKYMSRANSKVAAILGTGHHAPTQLEAVCAARPIERVYAWSRTPANVVAFCEKMTRKLGIPVEPAPTARDAVREADIVTTITSSMEPVLFGDWLRAGTHVNLVGAMKITCREADSRVLERADVLAVDDVEQSKAEAAEFVLAVKEGKLKWQDVLELSQVVASDTPKRTSADAITVFKSHGIGLWDVAAAARVYQLAKRQSVGVHLPIEQPVVVLGGGDPSRIKV